jgi:hypothetical protein
MTGSAEIAAFLGVWEMVSLRRFRDDAFDRYPMGEQAWGRITYGPETMSAFIMSPDWRSGEPVPSFQNLVTYAARWEYADGVIRHHVHASSIPSWEGTMLLRYATQGDDGTLNLRTEAHLNKKGERVHDELLWRKLYI